MGRRFDPDRAHHLITSRYDGEVKQEYLYEDVIGRQTKVSLSNQLNAGAFNGERVLITGAGGSIGSKIAEALSKFSNIQMLATDRDENRLHSLSLRLMGSALFDSSQFQVLDVKDVIGVRNCIIKYRPTILIHAAALKHLAVLEKQPREAYLTNVLGTYNLLSTASSLGVNRLLNISTDKAANPVSVLGKTKYIGELLTSKYRSLGNSNFTSVRFGNVFNSHGSVIETFASQLEKNSPVTLTDLNVARYFMKIEEAASLSLRAVLLNHNDVHILNMGEQIKLVDVVNKMKKISQSNSVIEIVGLRKGEKLREELHSGSEMISATSFPDIQSIKSAFIYSSLPDLNADVTSDIEALDLIEALIRDNAKS